MATPTHRPRPRPHRKLLAASCLKYREKNEIMFTDGGEGLEQRYLGLDQCSYDLELSQGLDQCS